MNSRRSLPYITVAPDTLLSQKKKKTWQCFGGKGPKVILSDIVIFCVFSVLVLQYNSMQASANSLALLRSSHVMNELLETERAYVEELLCVLEVSVHHVCMYVRYIYK